MTHSRQPHYIRDNRLAKVPRRLIVVHMEATVTRNSAGETRRWRCASAIFTHWTSRGYRHQTTANYTSANDLWADVADFTRARTRTALYMHNLPYGVRITQALTGLTGQGFALAAIRLADRGTWSRWSRDSATLTLCDSASLFPMTIYTMAKTVGMHKHPLPDDGDSAGWMERCARHAMIVSRVMVSYFEWLHTGVAGNWQVTGAGQAWSHWRHAHYTHKVLVHNDSAALAAERRAMWTGRAENWAWGRDLTIPVYEWDQSNAYPRLARDHPLPVRLVGGAARPSQRDLRALLDRWAVLADVTVTTDVPVAPTGHEGRVLWPVGTFATTLWSPEIELCLSVGATVEVHRVWLYRREPVLAQWGDWILGQLHTADPARPPWAGALLKHWSRALIGRFATQYQEWDLLGRDDVERVTTGRLFDTRTGVETDFMQVGRDVHVMTGTTESDDSCPQITSYVMSLARVRLWDIITAAGEDTVLYMDTDSVVVNTTGHCRIEQAVRQGRFDGLRLKGRHRGVEIYGPRTAVIGSETKLSGIPRDAQRVSHNGWVGEIWTSLNKALSTKEVDRVTVVKRRYTIRWNTFRRARVVDGRTVPYRLPGYRPDRTDQHAQQSGRQDGVALLREALQAQPAKLPIARQPDAVTDAGRIAGYR